MKSNTDRVTDSNQSGGGIGDQILIDDQSMKAIATPSPGSQQYRGSPGPHRCVKEIHRQWERRQVRLGAELG
ncbi:MAG TPA: hypothetical protein VM848_16865 [Acidimicrobiia bacterium]|nr:hypothetical protein [Acidimicrobiia bacterium]